MVSFPTFLRSFLPFALAVALLPRTLLRSLRRVAFFARPLGIVLRGFLGILRVAIYSSYKKSPAEARLRLDAWIRG